MLISGLSPSFEDINLETNWSPFPMEDGSVRWGVDRSRAPKSTSSELSSLALKVRWEYTHFQLDSIQLWSMRRLLVLVLDRWRMQTSSRHIMFPWTWGTQTVWFLRPTDHQNELWHTPRCQDSSWQQMRHRVVAPLLPAEIRVIWVLWIQDHSIWLNVCCKRC